METETKIGRPEKPPEERRTNILRVCLTEEERELRNRFGYVDLSGEEVMIDADHIVTIEGAEIIGIIIDRSGDTVLVKTASATVPVPKNRILGAPTVVQVPATDAEAPLPA